MLHVYCTVLYCTVLCIVLSYTVLYYTMLHVYCTVLYCTVLYCAILYCTVLIEAQIHEKTAVILTQDLLITCGIKVVEHLTSDQKVLGSNPSWSRFFLDSHFISNTYQPGYSHIN